MVRYGNWADPRVRCTNYLEQQQGLFTGRGANGGTRPVRTLDVLAAEGATSNYCVLADLFGRGHEFTPSNPHSTEFFSSMDGIQ